MRQLAAILFTDIAGYTAMMQKDERKAIATRQTHRKIFEGAHEHYQGNIIQYYGDGTLSIFKSAIQAVTCALEMQKELQAENIPVRMGLHVGDIIHSDTEVYGDGVNVASRIESLSVPGAVLFSERVQQELSNQQQFATETLGRFEFKNVAHPIEVFALSNEPLVVPAAEKVKGKGHPIRSIAVLPFVNMSTSEENEFFSDGITEEIINALTKVPELKVTSRTSSFHFKKSELRLQQIGKELNVANILEGSVRLAGKQMRITAQLIDVGEDAHFWSETFDRQLDNIFEVQDEISLLIADKLREHVGHMTIEKHLVKDPHVPGEAYSEYLRSRHLLLKMHKADIDRAIEILLDLITRQPDYVYAYLGLHQAYTFKAVMGFMSSAEGFAEGYKYLSKAIELDETLPECQLQLAWIAYLQDWDAAKAYEHLARVEDGLPLVDYYQTMASVLLAERKFKTANRYLQTAMQLDPFSDINHHLLGSVFYLQEDYEEAIAYYLKSLELKPEGAVSNLELGLAYILTAKFEEALVHFQNLTDTSDDIMRDGGQAMVHCAMGEYEKAQPLINSLEEARNTDDLQHALHLLIFCETLRGNHEQAIDYLAKAFEYRFPLLVYIKVDPVLKPLRQYPRFRELMDQVLPSVSSTADEPSRYKKSLLDPELLSDQRKALVTLMQESQPYLDPYLSLRDLAEKLGIPANQLSQLLNEGFDQNFSEFVNSYRLTAFKEKVSDPANQNFTILALAYESGFNSKTVFNTYFKKATGMTPKAYWKSVHS